MKQLGILDSAFINLERPNTPQHIGGVGIYDPSTAQDGFVRFKQVLANFEQRLNSLPMFRTRLIKVPGDIDRPYWKLDKNFDVEFHLRHIGLPKPGDWRQLCIQVARLHARPLDMSRPLWEAYIIEGLDNIPDIPEGSFAIYIKLHHSLVDGGGSNSFMSVIHDLEPTPAPREVPESQKVLLVDRQTSNVELLAKAVANSAMGSIDRTKGAIGITKQAAKAGLAMARKELPMPEMTAPMTRFNQPVGPYRVFSGTLFDLEDFKTIKNATETKVNDVALAVVCGALIRYLEDKHELPDDGSLGASIPMNMRERRRDAEDDNNQTGAVFTSLHSDVDDPVKRVKAIHQSMLEAKEIGENTPFVDALKLAGVFSPRVSKQLTAFYAKNNISQKMPVRLTTVVTNVPGPNFDLYCSGARMVRYFGIGLLTPGCGLFHTVYSAAGKITLSVLADRDMMPDPEFYIDCLQNAFKELLAASTKPAKKKAVKATEKRTAKTTRSAKTAPSGKTATKAKRTAKAKASKAPTTDS